MHVSTVTIIDCTAHARRAGGAVQPTMTSLTFVCNVSTNWSSQHALRAEDDESRNVEEVSGEVVF